MRLHSAICTPATLTVAVFGLTTLALAESSGPTGQWYLRANGYALSASITSPSSGTYTGTLINDAGGAELLDSIAWDASSRTLQFRRNGSGFWQWYFGKVVEGIWVGHFSQSTISPQKPADLTDLALQVTAWNSTYLDTASVPRVWEILIDGNDLARLRIDAGSGGLTGRLKVYSSLSEGAADEQLEYNLDAITWDGTHLAFSQHLDDGTVRTYQGATSGRNIAGSYLPGNGVFSGTRAEVLTYGIAAKSATARAQWISRTRLQLCHLMMAGNPKPLSRTVTVLGSNLPPTPSVSFPPDRDDNPAAWPQNYSLSEIRFDYTLPNSSGAVPLARSSHG